LEGNEDATRLSGIDVDRTKTAVYTIAAILAGIGGLILLGQTNTGQPQAASGYELNAIAGGCSRRNSSLRWAGEA